MARQIQHFVQAFFDDQDSARVMASTRGISRFGNGPTAESYIHVRPQKAKPRIRAKNTSKIAKLGREGDWLAQNFELSKDFDFVLNSIVHAS